MFNRLEGFRVLDLVQPDLFRLGVLKMPNAAVDEVVPDDFQFTEAFFEMSEYRLYNVGFSCYLDIVYVLRENADKSAIVVSEAKLWIDLAGDKFALIPSDLAELHAEGSRRINKSCAGLVTVKYLGLGVEVLEAGDLPKQRDTPSRQVEVHLSTLFACELG